MNGENSLTCKACPYIYTLDRQVSRPCRWVQACRAGRRAPPGQGPALLRHPCPTCHAAFNLQLVKVVPLKKKEVDDVLGGEEAWANVQKTDGAGLRGGGWFLISVWEIVWLSVG